MKGLIAALDPPLPLLPIERLAHIHSETVIRGLIECARIAIDHDKVLAVEEFNETAAG